MIRAGKHFRALGFDIVLERAIAELGIILRRSAASHRKRWRRDVRRSIISCKRRAACLQRYKDCRHYRDSSEWMN